MRFSDDVCVVTGAGSGIGRAVARRFAAEGARVACVDIDADAAAAAAEEIAGAEKIATAGGSARAYACDVGDNDAVEDALGRIEADFGEPLSVLHANAGIEGPIIPFWEVSPEDWDRVFAVNVRGPFLCAKHAVPSMRRKGRGSIVLTGSNSSFIAFPGWAAYTASKGAVLMLAKSLAIDLAPENIRVNVVCPGPTDTAMFRRGHPSGSSGGSEGGGEPELSVDGRLGTADEIANVVLFAASADSSAMTASALVADYGNTARGGPTWPSEHYWTV
jgi:NAD(P)-dependent dehydrogenase (short-subunit alcohol dehydrogenase family)